jgi:hypothetical protein
VQCFEQKKQVLDYCCGEGPVAWSTVGCILQGYGGVMHKLFVFALLAAVVPLKADAGWFSYDNYEDCMLGRMKGQLQTMYGTAMKACQKEFGVEFSIGTRGVKWKSYVEPGVGAVIVIEEVDPEYQITTGKFKAAKMKCEESKPEDFTETLDLKFDRTGKAPVDLVKSLTNACAKAEDFKAKYK